MTTDAKETIAAAILTQKGTFTCANITEETGLARQIVFRYLTKYTEKGYLEKHSHVYFPLNREALVDQLLQTKHSSDDRRFELTPFWLRYPGLLLNKESVNWVMMARALDLTGSADMKTAMIEELDLAIKALMREKKYLATGKRSPNLIAKTLHKGYRKTFQINYKEKIVEIDTFNFIKNLYDSLGLFMESLPLSEKEATEELKRKVAELIDRTE